MPTDLTVILGHRPGELARLGEIAGEAGVTIHGLAAFTGEGTGVVHMLLDDEAVAGCRAGLCGFPADRGWRAYWADLVRGLVTERDVPA
jgi:hypothetical protein